MVGSPPVMTQMVEQFKEQKSSIVAVQDVNQEHTNRYGIVSGPIVGPNLIQMSGIIEKPSPEEAPTTLAVVGRYILTPSIFKDLETTKPGVGGEIQLTDGIAKQLLREKVFAYRYIGTRYDCGSKLGFLQATVDLGEQHLEVGKDFSRWLSQRD